MCRWADLAASDAVSEPGHLVSRPSPMPRSARSSSAARRNPSAGSCWARESAWCSRAGSPAYAVIGITRASRRAPGGPAGRRGWPNAVFFPAVALLGCVFLLFPTGTLLSRRWRPVAAAGFLATGLPLTGFIVSPRLVALPAPGGVSLMYPNPFGVKALGRPLSGPPITTSMAAAAVSVRSWGGERVSLVVRYRAGDRRAAAADQLAGADAAPCSPWSSSSPRWASWPATVSGRTSAMPRYTASADHRAVRVPGRDHHRDPQAPAVRDRRHHQPGGRLRPALGRRSRPCTPASCWASGRSPGAAAARVLTITAAVAIALLFQPVRQPARSSPTAWCTASGPRPTRCCPTSPRTWPGSWTSTEAVDRMVTRPGRRDRRHPGRGVDPGRRTAAPGGDLAGRVPRPRPSRWPDGGLPAVRGRVAGGRRPARRRTARRAVPAKARNEPLTSAEDKLLAAPGVPGGARAPQRPAHRRAAGHHRRTAGLPPAAGRGPGRRAAEDRAQPARRRQQQLVALTIQLGLLEESAEDAAAVRQLSRGCRTRPGPRSTTCGPWPAASTPRCSPTRAWWALQAQARKAPLPVTVEADGIGRYPQDAEADRVLLRPGGPAEHRQVRRRHPGGPSASSCPAGSREFTITDDGAGFDTRPPAHGTGLQGMADRLAALGGTLGVRSPPGHGTTVSARLPVPGS